MKIRKTLFRQEEGTWHYCRFETSAAGELKTSEGRCGTPPERVYLQSLPPGAQREEALKEAIKPRVEQGYHDFSARKLPILEISAAVGDWDGWLAAAPWFEDIRQFYYEPLQSEFDRTANGIPFGTQYKDNNFSLHFAVFDPLKAETDAQTIIEQAPVEFSILMRILPMVAEEKEDTSLTSSIEGLVPDLKEILKKEMETLAQNIKKAIGDPDFVLEYFPDESISLDRKKADHFRRLLLENWGFDGHGDSLASSSPDHPILLAKKAELEKDGYYHQIIEQLKEKNKRVLEYNPLWGILHRNWEELSFPSGECLLFDDSLSWVIFHHHSGDVSFGGKGLVDIVQDTRGGL